jgi:uncharacterized protein YgbK (DUF1537 family)
MEMAAAADVLAEPVDGFILAPFFLEGGRYTVRDVHWVEQGDMLVPAAETAYAKDASFGYACSYLPAWVEEKTRGRVRAADVISISVDDLRRGGPAAIAERLEALHGGRTVVVNAAAYRDLEVFVAAVQGALAHGKRFMFRTAASFVKVMAGIGDRPLLAAEEMLVETGARSGLTVVGSHVPKSTAQLERARRLHDLVSVELPVEQVLHERSRDAVLDHVAVKASRALAEGRDALIFTSREVVTGGSREENLAISSRVSAALVSVVRRLGGRPRYLIAKGGVTASDLATDALDARTATILGQVLPGVPVWRLGSECRWSGVPYVVFPGNVGSEDALTDVIRMLRRSPQAVR